MSTPPINCPSPRRYAHSCDEEAQASLITEDVEQIFARMAEAIPQEGGLHGFRAHATHTFVRGKHRFSCVNFEAEVTDRKNGYILAFEGPLNSQLSSHAVEKLDVPCLTSDQITSMGHFVLARIARSALKALSIDVLTPDSAEIQFTFSNLVEEAHFWSAREGESDK